MSGSPAGVKGRLFTSYKYSACEFTTPYAKFYCRIISRGLCISDAGSYEWQPLGRDRRYYSAGGGTRSSDTARTPKRTTPSQPNAGGPRASLVRPGAVSCGREIPIPAQPARSTSACSTAPALVQNAGQASASPRCGWPRSLRAHSWIPGSGERGIQCVLYRHLTPGPGHIEHLGREGPRTAWCKDRSYWGKLIHERVKKSQAAGIPRAEGPVRQVKYRELTRVRHARCGTKCQDRLGASWANPWPPTTGALDFRSSYGG